MKKLYILGLLVLMTVCSLIIPTFSLYTTEVNISGGDIVSEDSSQNKYTIIHKALIALKNDSLDTHWDLLGGYFQGQVVGTNVLSNANNTYVIDVTKDRLENFYNISNAPNHTWQVKKINNSANIYEIMHSTTNISSLPLGTKVENVGNMLVKHNGNWKGYDGYAYVGNISVYNAFTGEYDTIKALTNFVAIKSYPNGTFPDAY